MVQRDEVYCPVSPRFLSSSSLNFLTSYPSSWLKMEWLAVLSIYRIEKSRPVEMTHRLPRGTQDRLDDAGKEGSS